MICCWKLFLFFFFKILLIIGFMGCSQSLRTNFRVRFVDSPLESPFQWVVNSLFIPFCVSKMYRRADHRWPEGRREAPSKF
jgi:hypothetical protein